MLEYLPETKDDLLAVKASGKLTNEDYERVLIPYLDQLTNKYDQIKLLFYMDPSFKGWELDALWEDTKVGFKYNKEFEKLAVVGAPEIMEWGMKLAKQLIDTEIKTFGQEELSDAKSWVVQ
jgi:hypothetical protein